MKNENAIMDRIKARIAYHANEHRHTYEIGKGVMDFLARDLLADFKAAGGLLPPVALDGDVYVIYRRKPVKAKVIFIGINADRLFFFNVLLHADDDRVVRCDCFEAIPEEGDSE